MGAVVRDLKLSGDRESADVEDTIPISQSGWCLLRAWSDKAEHPVLDAYPYATTSPIYVTVAGSLRSQQKMLPTSSRGLIA